MRAWLPPGRAQQAALWAALLITGCGSNSRSATLFNFERAGSFTFACAERDSDQLVELERCSTFASKEQRELHYLYSLVTQRSRGEVALVRFDFSDLDRSRVKLLDRDVRIPGRTFTPVGEIPSAIVTPEQSPEVTYLAHIGSRAVWATSTGAFFPSGSDLNADVRVFGTSPVDLALSPAEDALFVALPEEESIAIVGLSDGMMGEPQLVQLDPSYQPSNVVEEEVTYEKLCPAGESLLRPTLEEPSEISLGDAARPAAFAVDATPGAERLLVADSALPKVHVFALPGLIPLPPLYPGVPLRELALTPPVPQSAVGDSTVDDSTAAARGMSRYLYGIDATDGSLLVMNYQTGDLLSTGATPEVLNTRIELPAPVRSIEVVTPRYSPTFGGYCDPDGEDAKNASPIRLRGVFLAAALSDGTVQMLDVLDLDAPCRGGPECADPPSRDDNYVYIKRHRPRVGTKLRVRSTLVGVPSMAAEGSPIRIESDGTTDPINVPDLIALEGCPAAFERVFPSEGEPLICSSNDPWARGGGQWIARYNGALPSAQGSRGFLAGAEAELVGQGSFCAAGVLSRTAAETVGDEEPESGYGGDALVLVGDLPESAPSGCNDILELDDAGRRIGPAFVIAGASIDRLQIASRAEGSLGTSLQRARECFGEFVEYEVRTRGAFTVVSEAAGFLHRVRADERGVCRLDLTLPADRAGRALPDRTYQDPWITFRIGQVAEEVRSARFQVELGDPPATLRVDLSANRPNTLPVAMQYNALDEHLYVLDSATQGLTRISLAEFKAVANIQ